MCDVISTPWGSPPLVSVTIICDWLLVPRTVMVMVMSCMCSGVPGHTGEHHTSPVVYLQDNNDAGDVIHVVMCTKSPRRPLHTSYCLTPFLWKSKCQVQVQGQSTRTGSQEWPSEIQTEYETLRSRLSQSEILPNKILLWDATKIDRA